MPKIGHLISKIKLDLQMALPEKSKIKFNVSLGFYIRNTDSASLNESFRNENIEWWSARK